MRYVAIILLIFLLISPANAFTVRLAWDANTEPDLAGYRLYFSETSKSYSDTPIWKGTATQADVVVTTEGFFVCTAVDNAGNESGYSNEVSFDIAPIPPSGCKILSIER